MGFFMVSLLIRDLRDNIPLVAETLDEFPKGLLFLLHNVGQVPFNPLSLASGLEVTDELVAQVQP
jgi:hypothetical protein